LIGHGVLSFSSTVAVAYSILKS